MATLGEPAGALLLGGQCVRHAKFGEGVVLDYDARARARVQGNFANPGVKWLLPVCANLESV